MSPPIVWENREVNGRTVGEPPRGLRVAFSLMHHYIWKTTK
jgi:hypothetical protein